MVIDLIAAVSGEAKPRVIPTWGRPTFLRHGRVVGGETDRHAPRGSKKKKSLCQGSGESRVRTDSYSCGGRGGVDAVLHLQAGKITAAFRGNQLVQRPSNALRPVSADWLHENTSAANSSACRIPAAGIGREDDWKLALQG